MVIKTDLSNLDDADIGILQNHYAEIMSSTELLVKVADNVRADRERRGVGVLSPPISITTVYVSCKTAILELGAERERRREPQTAKRREMP